MNRKLFFFLLCFFSNILVAQNYEITFGIAADNESILDSIRVENIEQGKILMLKSTDILQLNASISDIDLYLNQPEKIRVYPNPFRGSTNIVFHSEQAGIVNIRILDILGKLVTQESFNNSSLDALIILKGLSSGLYIVNISDGSTTESEIIISESDGELDLEISIQSVTQRPVMKLAYSKKASGNSEVVEMQYNEGETLLFSGYLQHLQKEISIIPVGNSMVSFDFHPGFNNSVVSTPVSSEESILQSLKDPFGGVQLHDPTHLALIKRNASSSVKKSANLEEDPEAVYGLYELLADSLYEISGFEGNKINFKGVSGAKQIKESWVLYYGDQIVIETFEKELNYSFQVNIDTICLADTIPLKTSSYKPHSNRGDSILISLDSLSYRDTLWVRHQYRYVDTIQTTVDTAQISKIKNYKSLLINTTTGNIYDLGTHVSFGFDSKCDNYCIRGNIFYFLAGSGIGKVNLDDMSFEEIQLPYSFNAWTVVDGNIFFFSYSQFPKAFCYKPGQGLITKSNVGINPDVGMVVDYEELPHVWIREFQGDVRYYDTGGSKDKWVTVEQPGIYSPFSLSLMGDSMVFSPATVLTEFNSPMPIFDYFSSSIGDYREKILLYKGETWNFNITDRIAWAYNSKSDSIRIYDYEADIPDWEVMGRMIMNSGQRYHFSLYSNSVYRLDIEELTTVKLFDVFEMEISEFRTGANSNFFISGTRFSDFSDVVVEYDCATGAKLNEWVTGNSPPKTNIVYLTPLTF